MGFVANSWESDANAWNKVVFWTPDPFWIRLEKKNFRNLTTQKKILNFFRNENFFLVHISYKFFQNSNCCWTFRAVIASTGSSVQNTFLLTTTDVFLRKKFQKKTFWKFFFDRFWKINTKKNESKASEKWKKNFRKSVQKNIFVIGFQKILF